MEDKKILLDNIDKIHTTEIHVVMSTIFIIIPVPFLSPVPVLCPAAKCCLCSA